MIIVNIARTRNQSPIVFPVRGSREVLEPGSLHTSQQGQSRGLQVYQDPSQVAFDKPVKGPLIEGIWGIMRVLVRLSVGAFIMRHVIVKVVGALRAPTNPGTPQCS